MLCRVLRLHYLSKTSTTCLVPFLLLLILTSVAKRGDSLNHALNVLPFPDRRVDGAEEVEGERSPSPTRSHSPVMDRNPSPPPETAGGDEDGDLDAIGDTVYSKHWLFSTLTRLINVRYCCIKALSFKRDTLTLKFVVVWLHVNGQNDKLISLFRRWSQSTWRWTVKVRWSFLMMTRKIFAEFGTWQWTRSGDNWSLLIS